MMHENTPRFPAELLDHFLGHMYVIESAAVDATSFGQPCCTRGQIHLER